MKNKSDKHAAIISTARERYERGLESDRDNREEAYEDLLFFTGDQWPDLIKQTREREDQPCMTFNRLPQFVRQVTGEIRQNKPGIKVMPADNEASEDTADTMSGLVRYIEYISNAKDTYVASADMMVTCGVAGGWRIIHDYIDDRSFDQDLIIELIPDPMSVVWDPASKRSDRQDAMWCFVVEPMTKEAFDQQFPDASGSNSWDDPLPGHYGHYHNHSVDDDILVAEYWVKEPFVRRLAKLEDGKVVDVTEWDKGNLEFLAGKASVKEIESHKITRYLLAGDELLDDPREWKGRYFPIVPVIGEEMQVGRNTVRRGLVRDAKDSQRLFNYSRTSSAERVALEPKSPFVAPADTIEPYKEIWKNANKKALPYLPYAPQDHGHVPQRAAPPFPATGHDQQSLMAAEDMKAVTGIYDAALGAKSNETSGVAINARDRQGDTATFHLIDNFNASIALTGRILVDLIPHIYDTERTIFILGEDNKEEQTVLNQTVQFEDGSIGKINDLSLGKYAVRVSTGPSFQSRRAESSTQMIEFARGNPQVAAVIMDLIAESQDWPLAEKIAERLKKMLPQEILDDDEKKDTGQDTNPQNLLAQFVQSIEARDKEADIAKKEAEVESIDLDNLEKQLQIAMQSESFGPELQSRIVQALRSMVDSPPQSAGRNQQQPQAPQGAFFNA